MNRIGKRSLVTLFLTVIMLLFTTTALAASGTVKVDSLVLREEKSTKSDALQTLSKGEEVTIIHQDGSWYKVKYGRYTGYVMTRYIKTSDTIPDVDDETIKSGDRGEAVKEVQERLQEQGYYDGKIDGVFGSGMLKAVKAFQERNGLTADGVIGETTLKKLNSSSAKKAATSSSSSSSSADKADEDDGTLREGARGQAVKDVQQRLKELGYYSKSIDGVYGSGTIKAVKAFQERNGLTVDGVVGETTLKKLNSSSAKKAADDDDEDDKTASSDDDGALREGARGQAVKDVQQRLKELGYYNKSIDGVYGSGTIAAVKAFQERNRLTVDGVVGETTLKILNSSSAKKAADDAKEEDSSSSSDDSVLRPGAKSEAVRTLQAKLRELGYYTGSRDGVYGDSTTAAVKAFQKKHGLYADGIAGEATLKKLYSSSALKADEEDVNDDEVEQLKAGDYGAAVKKLQNRLKELGYYKTTVDGSYGSLTKKAVKAFQSRNGLTADGVAGKATLNKIYSSSAKAAADADDDEDSSSGSSSSSGSTDGTLRPGDTGDEVKEMQYRLRELGYYSGSRDGVYGSGTRKAVLAFQANNGLTQDSIAGSKTLKLLYSSDAKKAGSSSSSGSSSGSSSSGDTSTTLKPGDSGAAVRKMQERLKELGYYSNTIDGEFGYGTRQALISFQKLNGLTQDGIAGEDTLKKLYSSSAKKYTAASSGTYVTERLDWFNGGASRIPRGAIFQVKDVKTGLVFTAKRQAGASHLDAEPLTAADTAILKKINGGSFSWRRRPMLVLYNGRVYACSIYSEPHGDDTIADNNFDGQFCLHFYGSMTHGTDRVDEDHQACEAEALKATW
ncbi:MAG: peptidoglycan-binding protein [Clostridia bacterium]|nr:peptidoglycan-binding protein [Clostridia bacterium]